MNFSWMLSVDASKLNTYRANNAARGGSAVIRHYRDQPDDYQEKQFFNTCLILAKPIKGKLSHSSLQLSLFPKCNAFLSKKGLKFSFIHKVALSWMRS